MDTIVRDKIIDILVLLERKKRRMEKRLKEVRSKQFSCARRGLGTQERRQRCLPTRVHEH
jgi:hypothetical protein